jgi:hypothetical protein
MNLHHHSFFAALAAAAISVGCAPTDADTSTKVKANLTADAAVKAAPIDVAVQKNVVTLTGTVDSQVLREQAVALARKTDGVAEVVDKLVVKEPDFGPGHGREMMGREMGSVLSKEPLKDERRQ